MTLRSWNGKATACSTQKETQNKNRNIALSLHVCLLQTTFPLLCRSFGGLDRQSAPVPQRGITSRYWGWLTDDSSTWLSGVVRGRESLSHRPLLTQTLKNCPKDANLQGEVVVQLVVVRRKWGPWLSPLIIFGKKLQVRFHRVGGCLRWPETPPPSPAPCLKYQQSFHPVPGCFHTHTPRRGR